MNFHDNSENKNRKFDFPFDSAHCASFMKGGSKLRGGGLLIVKWYRAHIIIDGYMMAINLTFQNYSPNKSYKWLNNVKKKYFLSVRVSKHFLKQSVLKKIELEYYAKVLI